MLAQEVSPALMIINYIKEQNYLEDGEDLLLHLMNLKVLIKDLILKFRVLIMMQNMCFQI